MPAHRSSSLSLSLFLLLSVFIMSSHAGFAQQQEPQIRDFEFTSCLGAAPAMQAFYNDIVKIGCDTAWVMNKTRYNLMTKAMDYVLKKDPDEGLKLVAQYESSLNTCTANYAELLKKHTEMATDVSRANHENIQYMQGIRNDLEKAKQALAQANKNLEDTQKILTKKDKKIQRTHWLFGAGGLGAGLLIGLLIFGG